MVNSIRPMSLNIYAPTADVGFIGNLAPFSANRPVLNPLNYGQYISSLFQPSNDSFRLNPMQFQNQYYGGFNWNQFGLNNYSPYAMAIPAGAASFPAFPRAFQGGYNF